MRKNTGFFISVLLSTIVGVGMTANRCPAQDRMTVRLAGNHAPPYRIFKEGQASGIYIDVMRELAKRTGLDVRFIEVPFKRALAMMQYGNADIMLGPNRTEEREAYMVYTDATFQRENKIFYVHPDAPAISAYEDLAERTVIVHRGKVYFDRLDNDGTLKKLVVEKYIHGINKVVADPGFTIIMPEQEGDWLLKESGVRLEKSPYIVEGRISYITLSKESQFIQVREKIEEAMREMKKDGIYRKILDRYR
ncbi:MAG: transporter substrate-binding domain-containing protein [Acidobacteriota bacterium]